MAKDIGEGRWRDYGQPAVFNIARKMSASRRNCSAVKSPATAISRRSIPQRVLRWSEYSAKAVARIQARGMPIDMHLWNLVQENKAAVDRRIDPAV